MNLKRRNEMQVQVFTHLMRVTGKDILTVIDEYAERVSDIIDKNKEIRTLELIFTLNKDK